MPTRKGQKSAAQTPAPPKERISGSKVNPKGSASSEKEAKGIVLSPNIITSLKSKLAEFKEANPKNTKITLPDLKAVFRRGAGAYSKSHRPTITGGVPNSRNAWAFARVNKFLKKASGEKVKAAYVQDDDLMKMEDGGLVAPNGRRSNLTLEQYKLVRTPQFKKWFGDWENDPENASKVVDENGEPLVCYHGTPHEFYTFKDVPHFFSKSKKVAETYSKNVLSVFLNIRTPFVYDASCNEYSETYGLMDMLQTAISKARLSKSDIVIKNWGEYKIAKETDGIIIENIVDTYYTSKDEEVSDEEYEKWLKKWCSANYITSNSNQIKLADGINTTFDSSNPDIRYENGGATDKVITCVNCGWSWEESKSTLADKYICHKCGFDNQPYYRKEVFLKEGGSTLLAPNGEPSNLTPEQYKLVRTPEFKAWFGDWEKKKSKASKVVDSNGEPLVVYHGTNAKFYVFDTDEESKTRETHVWNAEYPDGYIFMTSNKNIAKRYGKRLIPLFVNLPFPEIRKVKRGESLVKPFDDEGLAYEGDAIVTDGIDYIVGTQDEFSVKLADGRNTTFDGSNPDIRYEDGGTILLAPNGKPSNLTPEQYKLVRTPQFKAWFGDWENDPKNASKVLDWNREPLVVYHGTREKFDVFNGGAYFTNDYWNADGYASGELILETFLNIRNPLIINARGKKWNELETKYGSSTGEIVSKLEDKFDGVIFNNINDNWFDDEGSPQNVFFANNPNQIKLADGTNTTFDMNNPDIRYKEGGKIGGFEDLEDEWLSKKIEIFLDKSKPFKFYYVDPKTNSLTVGFDENVTQEHLEKVYREATSSKEYFHGNTVEATFNKEIGDTIFKIKLRKKVEYANGGEMEKESCEKLDSKGERKIDPKSIEELTKCVEKLPQTKTLHFDEDKNDYDKERKELHRKIIFDVKRGVVCIQNKKPIAILMGGSPASGKSTFVRKYAPYLMGDNILKVDADEIRAKLPEYKGWNASQTHLETKDIVTTLLSDRNIGLPCAYDIIYDGTMNNVKTYKPLVRLLKSLGYRVFIVYIDKVEKEVVEKRNLDRYKRTGRFVPPPVIADFFEKGTSSLNELKTQVDGYMIVDGSDGKYSIIETGGSKVPKTRAYGKIGYPAKIDINDVIKGFRRGGEIDAPIRVMSNIDYDHLDESQDIPNDGEGVFKKGGEISDDDKKETYKKWRTLVNMSKGELEKFYNSEEGKVAGLTPSQAKSQGIDSGRESARWIMKMKDTKVSEWTPTMWEWAKKQISFISRMSGNKGSLFNEKDEKTRKHTSLLIWGHNPQKKSAGAIIDLKSNSYNMNEHTFNDLPAIMGIQDGKQFLLKEDVFTNKNGTPKYAYTRYMVVECMGQGGIANTLNLKVIDTYGDGSLVLNQLITRPIRNIMNKGRELAGMSQSTFKSGGELNPDTKSVKQYFEHKSGDAGGLLVGKRHSEGGIKAINNSTGDKIEMEGGEVVITRDAVSDSGLHDFDGKKMTNREILSSINTSGGGVAFADGGDVSCKCIGKEYKFGGKTMTDTEIANRMNRGYGSKDAIKKGMEIEDKEHGDTFKLLQHGDIDYEKFLKRLVADHLSENPEYYEKHKK